ncbi:MAG: hypothetical protein WBY53_10070 [Acidobacteriaceae bacterium]
MTTPTASRFDPPTPDSEQAPLSTLEGARLQPCHQPASVEDAHRSAEGRSEAAGVATELPSSQPPTNPKAGSQ